MKKSKGTPRKKGSIIERVLHLAFELSQNKWKLGFSDGNKMRFKSIAARNLEQLHEEVEKAQVRFNLRGKVRIVSCYEAVRDGFWLHRYLSSCGIQDEVSWWREEVVECGECTQCGG